MRAANAFFQAALKEYPEDAALRTRWGELFLATHQNNEAVKLFQEALEIDAGYAPAKIGLAKIAAGRYEEKTREWAEQVIDETPDRALEAHLMLARAALEDGAIDAGDEALDEALELAEDHDRSPLEIYALKAARRSAARHDRQPVDAARARAEPELRRRLRDPGAFLRDHAPLPRGHRAAASAPSRSSPISTRRMPSSA